MVPGLGAPGAPCASGGGLSLPGDGASVTSPRHSGRINWDRQCGEGLASATGRFFFAIL